MTHDPLCPFASWSDERCYQPDAGVSICSIIAKVRADERAKVLADPPCICGVGDIESLAHIFGCPKGARIYARATRPEPPMPNA
jgi:hypothetical protein